MTSFAPTAVRASEIARCQRMASLRALGHEALEPDEQTLRYFARGHLYTEYVARQLAAKHGPDAIEREIEITHPLGIGHADIYIKPAELLVEVKSTVTPTTSSPMFDMAVEQLRIYLHYHPTAQEGALYLINPSDLTREDVFTVRLTDDDRQRIDDAMLEVMAGASGGPLPPRVCAKPTQARGRMCPFAEACFEHWEAPDTPAVTDRDALLVVAELAAIKANETEHRKALAALEQERKDAQSRLGELVPVGDSIVGPYAVKRIHKTRQPSFSAKAYEAAGHSLEPLAEFFRGGSEWDEYRIGEAHANGTVDFGEEAPW